MCRALATGDDSLAPADKIPIAARDAGGVTRALFRVGRETDSPEENTSVRVPSRPHRSIAELGA
jgi:hypothetical protein